MTSVRTSILLSGLVLSVGCGAKIDKEQLGGETHWLAACDPAAQTACGDELACVCGRCTQVCSTGSECDELGGAVCAAQGSVDFAAGCDAPPAKLCVRPKDVRDRDTDAGPSDTSPVTSSTAPGTPSSTPSATPGAACDELTPAQCADHPECRVVGGAPVDVEAQCYDYSVQVPLGCLGADVSCPPAIFIGKNAEGACYAFGNCLAPGFTMSDSAECSNALESQCPASGLLGDGSYRTSLEISPEFAQGGELLPETWYINLDVTVEAGEAEVWLAALGTLKALEPGAAAKRYHVTGGSYAGAGVVVGNALTLTNVTVTTGDGEIIQFEELSLTWHGNGSVSGTATGNWRFAESASSYRDFEGMVSGAPDVELTGAYLRGGSPQRIAPGESFTLLVPEPIPAQQDNKALQIRDEYSMVVLGNLIPIDDARPGFAIGFTVEPADAWPEGVLSVAIDLVDAAGNGAYAELLPIVVAVPTADAGTNQN